MIDGSIAGDVFPHYPFCDSLLTFNSSIGCIYFRLDSCASNDVQEETPLEILSKKSKIEEEHFVVSCEKVPTLACPLFPFQYIGPCRSVVFMCECFTSYD